MRVLITGGAGFLGSHLCDRLIGMGHQVVCVDNLVTGSMDNVAHLLGHERFTFINYNVCDYLYVEGGLDGVMHFASPASPQDYLEFPIAIKRSQRWLPRNPAPPVIKTRMLWHSFPYTR